MKVKHPENSPTPPPAVIFDDADDDQVSSIDLHNWSDQSTLQSTDEKVSQKKHNKSYNTLNLNYSNLK